jgi:hypothetical protein
MSQPKSPQFTPQAAKAWALYSDEDKQAVLESAFCLQCKGATTMFNLSGKVVQGDLVLSGLCAVCLRPVARLVDPHES